MLSVVYVLMVLAPSPSGTGIAQRSGSRKTPAPRQRAVAPKLKPDRRVADRAGDDNAVAGPGSRTVHHFSPRHGAEGENRHRNRTRRMVGVAAVKRTAVARGVFRKTGCKR